MRMNLSARPACRIMKSVAADPRAILPDTPGMHLVSMTLSLYLTRRLHLTKPLSTQLAGQSTMMMPTSHGDNGDDVVPVVHEGPDPNGGSHGADQDYLRSMAEAHAKHAL